jgi:hypothetical protein
MVWLQYHQISADEAQTPEGQQVRWSYVQQVRWSYVHAP